MQVVTVATDKACAAGFDRAKEFLQSRLYGNHRQRIPGIGSYTHTHTHTYCNDCVCSLLFSTLFTCQEIQISAGEELPPLTKRILTMD